MARSEGTAVVEVPVLDKGFVRLVDVMGDDNAIVQAARVSYGEGTKTVREDAALIDYLMRHEHWSPFEMVEFKFHVKAPIFVARQWFRHRTASVNEISGRYSLMREEFYVPDQADWRFQSPTNKQGSEGSLMEVDDRAASLALQGYLARVKQSYEGYRLLLDLGVAREQARMVLPLSLYTEFYWKQDLRNLLHFIRLRSDPHAQKEIREYALAIAEIVKSVVPLSWSSFENHHLKGVRLSGDEVSAIRSLLDRGSVEEALKGAGLSQSRVREALEKLFGSDRGCLDK